MELIIQREEKLTFIVENKSVDEWREQQCRVKHSICVSPKKVQYPAMKEEQ